MQKVWASLLGRLGLTGRGARLDSATEAFDEGISCVDAGDLDAAIVAFTEAIRLDPKLAMAYCNRGGAYAKKADFQKAIADYTEAIRLNLKATKAYNNQGAAYDEKGSAHATSA